MKNKKHLFLGNIGKSQKYTYPRMVVSKTKIPIRDRNTHGENLSQQLSLAKNAEIKLTKEVENIELDSPLGVQLTFESFPDIELSLEKLADVRAGIELLSVIKKENTFIANILVPLGKFKSLEKKISDYLDTTKDNSSGPKHASLLNAISKIRNTVVENLWTDSPDLFPSSVEEVHWFEIWLPVADDRLSVIDDFKKLCAINEIKVSDSTLEFPERTILLVKTSIKSLANSSALLSKISEIRKSKTTAEFFDSLSIKEQRQWIDDLERRVISKPRHDKETPYVSILDTGVNIGHPLLSSYADTADTFTVDSNWDKADSNGHGTAMAGLAIWGDLASVLEHSGEIKVNHKLESIKLLRYPGDNEGKHLGQITADGISLSEIENFDRRRIYTMALSAKDSRDRGKPSAWSSELDSLCVDYLGENSYQRLFIVCAGNTGDDLSQLKEYPQYNELQDIHDPGQSWNALTIGAYTNKVDITDNDAMCFSPLAPNGGLSPYSTTSATWSKDMPIKPEVVFEGGNMGIDAYSAASISSLQLLSTHHDIQTRLFSTFNATSAATALASKFAAELYANYPNFRPETIRALIVHSAEWTDNMINQFSYTNYTKRKQAQHLVRCVGYGVPNIKKALWSASNSLAMIVEDELQPFEKLKGKEPSTRDMHIHDIPWPKEQLLQLGDTTVKMTVTLSYFIEPNPSSRNVSSKYRYPSHQLRFDVKRPTESRKSFLSRLSRAARDEEEGSLQTPSDPNWLLGESRNKGSIHKDIWEGTAADLAERGLLAVYPATGWWRTRKKLERYKKLSRYSLIVSIETPAEDIDLYSAIEAKIKSKISISN
ncbi:hypothetical protein GU3_09410 [Oceanimonas sp. GK1]|uniref:S8 family peptidase n=1 Tax=Oceanimonas sp. (strain GK1 / IBRC-M 10197) TaxID=511062 RepID=UPI0002494E25|nr:S8 family peptidase [Oceanimonas sp. GK1]AEY01638.1 hypothetical protein GU3_09410 [Oceanimonas sp. GK1]